MIHCPACSLFWRRASMDICALVLLFWLFGCSFPFLADSEWRRVVGAETASTADARHWDSTAPDGSCATDIVPSSNPRYLPGWSRALPTLQECDSTAVATIHLAYTLSLLRCLYLQTASTWLMPLCDVNLCNTAQLIMLTGFTCLTWYCSEPTCKSFCSIWCLLRQVLPLALNSTNRVLNRIPKRCSNNVSNRVSTGFFKPEFPKKLMNRLPQNAISTRLTKFTTGLQTKFTLGFLTRFANRVRKKVEQSPK